MHGIIPFLVVSCRVSNNVECGGWPPRCMYVCMYVSQGSMYAPMNICRDARSGWGKNTGVASVTNSVLSQYYLSTISVLTQYQPSTNSQGVASATTSIRSTTSSITTDTCIVHSA